MNLRQFYAGRAIGFFILLAVIGLVGGFYWLNNYIYQEKQGEDNTERMAEPLISATFNCPDGKSIYAGFFDGSVALALSDGRELTLPRAISASGARYANEDESIVFWNKGDGAFIEEGGVVTYKDCVTTPQE